jgi:hypothetical protein
MTTQNTHPANVPAFSHIPALPPVEWVYITPAKAEELLGKNHGNRNKKPQHIARLVRDMQNGNFLLSGDTIKKDWNGRLIDGQHRLSAIIESGIPAWVLVVQELDPKVQGVLDANAKRSAYDALGFNGISEARIIIAAMAKISLTRDAGKMRTALDTGSFSATNSEIVDWFVSNPDAEWAAKFSVKIARLIGSTPSVTAYSALIFGRIDMDACIEFFESTAEMRTTGDGDPRLTLLRTLERDRRNRGRQNNATQLSYFIRAWNTWRGGKKISKFPLEVGGQFVTIPEPK